MTLNGTLSSHALRVLLGVNICGMHSFTYSKDITVGGKNLKIGHMTLTTPFRGRPITSRTSFSGL